MKFGDQLSIETPELVTLEFPLAGIGSRFIAILIDYALRFAAFVALILGTMLFLPSMQKFESASREVGGRSHGSDSISAAMGLLRAV